MMRVHFDFCVGNKGKRKNRERKVGSLSWLSIYKLYWRGFIVSNL